MPYMVRCNVALGAFCFNRFGLLSTEAGQELQTNPFLEQMNHSRCREAANFCVLKHLENNRGNILRNYNTSHFWDNFRNITAQRYAKCPTLTLTSNFQDCHPEALRAGLSRFRLPIVGNGTRETWKIISMPFGT